MDEKMPATILSHVTRTPDRLLAISRFSTAVRVDESVETLYEVWSSCADRMSKRGITPILASMYTGKTAYLVQVSHLIGNLEHAVSS